MTNINLSDITVDSCNHSDCLASEAVASSAKKRAYKKNRATYGFESFVCDENIKMIFLTKNDALSARYAAHVLAGRRGWKFKTKIRETDNACYELDISRVQ